MAAAIAETAPAAGAASPGKGSKKKLIVLIAAVLVVLLAVGGGAAVYLKKKAAAAAAAAEEEGGAAGESAAASAHPDAHNPPAYLPLDPFIVNLADREADRYAQIGITLELDNAGSAETIRGYMPAVRNAILMVLASKTSKDLLDRTGKEALAEEIAREAVRPMGIEIAAPTPVKEAASGAEAAASTAKESKKADESEGKPKKKKPALQKNPITHVNFSSFIVQ